MINKTDGAIKCLRDGCDNRARVIYCSKQCIDKVRNDKRAAAGVSSITTLSMRVREDEAARKIARALTGWRVVCDE